MVLLILALLLTFLAILFKESKIITIGIFALMWILFGWNSNNGDYEAYEKIYDSSFLSLVNENYEIGYRLLCVGGNIIGLEFQEFLIVIAAIILSLWLKFILQHAIYPALVSLLFFWFFFPLDYVLLRNFLAFAIVLQGVASLIKEAKFKYIKFTIFVIIAYTIHSSSVFYLSFLLLAFSEGKELNFFRIFTLTVLGLIFYIFFAHNYIIGLLSLGNRDEFYQTNLITFIYLLIMQIASTVFIIYLYYKIKPDISNKPNFYLILFNINLIAFFLTIMYFDFSIFVRLYRNIAIINCLFITNAIAILPEKKFGLKLKLSVLFVYYLIFMFNFFITPYLEDTLYALFKNNLLL